MPATILILPVIRAEHGKQGTLATADRSNVIDLWSRSRRRRERRHVVLDLDALAEVWLANLMTAATLATIPLWPGGIDDLGRFE